VVLDKGLPNSHLRVIPGAGHLANLEQPEQFNRILIDFLNSLPG
jgi:pimeloyl-ACP methyl ester carboxylesterase